METGVGLHGEEIILVERKAPVDTTKEGGLINRSLVLAAFLCYIFLSLKLLGRSQTKLSEFNEL